LGTDLHYQRRVTGKEQLMLLDNEDTKRLAWLRDAIATAERTARRPYDFDSILTEAYTSFRPKGERTPPMR